MKIIKVLSLICFLWVGILAQQSATVTGQLNDAGKIIVNEKVKLVSQTESFETTTDANGNYRFENVANGNYLLVYNDKQASVKIENGKVSIAELAEVVVISANTTQTIDEVSKSVSVIGNQEIRERNEFSLTDSLRTIPGFRVQQLGGFGRTSSIKSRGLRNQDTAILIDGVRFRDAASITGDASPFLSDLTLTSVERIEILRGSGSSLYGTNAIGGTVDVLTQKPENGWRGGILGEAGGLGLKRFRGNFGGGNNTIGFTSGISRTIFSEGIDKEDDANNTNFQSRIEYNPFAKTNVSARFFISDAFVRLNTSPQPIGALPASSSVIIDAIPLAREELLRFENGTPASQLNRGNATFIPDANDPDNSQKSKFFNGQFVLTQIINNKLIFQGFYQGLETTRKNTNGILGVGFQTSTGDDETSVLDGLIHTAGGNFKWTANRNNFITFGYEYEWEKFFNEGITINPAANFSTGARQSTNTFFVQDLMSFFEKRLQIAGGFRAQVFSLKNPTFQGSNPAYQNLTLENPPNSYTFDGSVSYFFEKTGTKIRAHAGNGYRLPSLYERFGTFYSTFSGGFVAQGDPFLKPERSIGFDAGIDQSFSKGKAKLSAAYFYTDVKKSIDYAFCVPRCLASPDPFGRFSGYYNSEGRIARGIETSLDAKPIDSLNVFASYTYTNSDERNPLNLAVLKSLGVPTHQFSFVATQRIGRRFSVNFDFIASSSYFFAFYNFDFTTFAESYRIFRFKGARRGDVSAGYDIPTGKENLRFRVFGTIENVFDNEYYENGFRTPGRTARGGLSLNF
ncbi:MAG: TonB-dependent receptor [Pyrinomonadaceae bacterium]